jgi:hypothetical protein
MSSSRENFLFKWPKDICREIVAVHFGVSSEFIDNMESEWIPYDCKHELFVWISDLGFVAMSSQVRIHVRRKE